MDQGSADKARAINSQAVFSSPDIGNAFVIFQLGYVFVSQNPGPKRASRKKREYQYGNPKAEQTDCTSFFAAKQPYGAQPKNRKSDGNNETEDAMVDGDCRNNQQDHTSSDPC